MPAPKIITVLFAFSIWIVWYNNSTLSLATLFAPVWSPVYIHYVIPLADYYTTGEGRSPAFFPMLFVVLISVAFVSWRIWFHVKRWKASKTIITTAALMSILAVALGANEPDPPPKVSTSIGIYDVQSKEDIHQFTAEEIRELVKMEDDRTRGSGLQPHPVLVY